MSYQGWKNYETWNCKLWIDNDEPTYKFWRGNAKQTWRDRNEDESPEEQSRTARIILAKQLHNVTAEDCPQLEPSMYSDILHANLSEIDFYEIADAILSECELTGYKARPIDFAE